MTALRDAGGLFDVMAARLVDAARRLAEAHAADRLLARRDDAAHWRRPGLIWPLFAKD